MIDWIGLEQYLKSLTLHQRITMCKLIHNWQNTGKQKHKFASSSNHKHENKDRKTVQLIEEQQVLLSKCPFGCGECKTDMHYMECKAPIANKSREALIKHLKQKMEKRGLHEAIITLLLKGIQWHRGAEIPTMSGVVEGKVNTLIFDAMEEQSKIGWHNLCRGFISRKWNQAQTEYDKQTKVDTRDWSRTLVKWILDMSGDMWKERNNALHGNTTGETRGKVHVMYKRAKVLHTLNDFDIKEVFKLPEKKKKRQGVVALETWLRLAEKVLHAGEEEL